MDIDKDRFRNAYVDAGYNQETLAEATTKVDLEGRGIEKKTVHRMANTGKASPRSLMLVSRVLGVAEDTFYPDDPQPLDPRSKAFKASAFIIDLIDRGLVPSQYFGTSHPGEDFWEFLKHDIYRLDPNQPPRDRRHLSDSDFADGIDRLKRMCLLIELQDGSIRIVAPSAKEVLKVLDMRLAQEIDAIRMACKLPYEERLKITAEQIATYQSCINLLAEERYNDLVIVEASWHCSWAGDYAAIRRVLRNNLNLAMQVGDRMLHSGPGGTITCREEEYKAEFTFMLEELKQMQDAFHETRDSGALKTLITTHVGRSQRIIRTVESKRIAALKKLRETGGKYSAR
ncbi:hypothetical protein [Rhodopirellula bahusiensis]|uniref:hypothetical protein n=1 Tax=Rhodopirellula bahusiensis TaxID=2014065 RepID=UPI003265F1D5